MKRRLSIPPGLTASDPRFWESLYKNDKDFWELGGAAPPLVAHLKKDPPPKGKVAVLGCGRGHDVRLFSQLGYEAWGFDFARKAIREARQISDRENRTPCFECRDIFALPDHYPDFFDAVWEYTCFCAIDPARRPEYVRMILGILKPGGHLLANFFPVRDGAGGPPFPVDRREIERLFGPWFSFRDAYEPEDSVPQRRGLEWFVHACRSRTGFQTAAPQTGNLKG